jgi:hypothetical protein
MSRFAICTAFAFWLAAAAASAQEVLTLEAAVAAAVQNNRGIQNIALQVEGAEEEIGAAPSEITS